MRVLIVDDHAVVRGGVRNIVDEPRGTAVCGEAGTRAEALELVQQQAWDLVILDLSLGGDSGLNLLTTIRHLRPAVPILVLTMHPERQYARRVFKSGASGYVTKDGSSAELRQAIQRVLAGGRYVSPNLAETLAADLEAGSAGLPHESLSGREFEVMRLIASGRTVREIAALLSLSDRTVSTYRTRVLEKMQMKSSAELTHYAVRNGLTD
jgi:two-component system, NarL family, invasion response regulator UvrY